MNTSVRYETVDIRVMPEITVPGVVGTPEWWPSGRRVGVVLAHDQGSGLDQPLIVAIQEALAAEGHLTLRFAFPFAHEGRSRPDNDAILQRTFRAATNVLLGDRDLAPARLLVGGAGLGARIAALAVSSGLKVDGIAALGFPLHLAGKPHLMRADALFRIVCPILFIQGDRDPHCRLDRLEGLLQRLGAPSRVHPVRDAGQGLEPIKRTERTREDVFAETLSALKAFLQKISA